MKLSSMGKVCLFLCVMLLCITALQVQAAQEEKTREGSGPGAALPEAEPSDVEKSWGIDIQTLRLTAHDHFLDLRYRVLDPKKAADLLKRPQTAYLIHEASGTKLPVPETKLGPIRQSTSKPEAKRSYFVLFTNLGKTVKKGDKTTLVIGDFKKEHLTVE